VSGCEGCEPTLDDQSDDLSLLCHKILLFPYSISLRENVDLWGSSRRRNAVTLLCKRRLQLESCSLEVFDPLLLVEVSGIVDLELLVDGGHLGLDGVLVLSVDESKGTLGASVRGVHNEDELGLMTAVLGDKFEVVDGVSGLIGGHLGLEILKSSGSLADVLAGGVFTILTDCDDDESVGALHAEGVEGGGDGFVED
jgi:hypothetical protein